MRVFTIKNISASPLSIVTRGVNGYGGSIRHLSPEQEVDLLQYEISTDIDNKQRKNLISKLEKANIKTISYFSDSTAPPEKNNAAKEDIKEEVTAVKEKRKKGKHKQKNEL